MKKSQDRCNSNNLLKCYYVWLQNYKQIPLSSVAWTKQFDKHMEYGNLTSKTFYMMLDIQILQTITNMLIRWNVSQAHSCYYGIVLSLFRTNWDKLKIFSLISATMHAASITILQSPWFELRVFLKAVERTTRQNFCHE